MLRPSQSGRGSNKDQRRSRDCARASRRRSTCRHRSKGSPSRRARKRSSARSGGGSTGFSRRRATDRRAELTVGRENKGRGRTDQRARRAKRKPTSSATTSTRSPLGDRKREGCANAVHAARLYSWMRPPSRSGARWPRSADTGRGACACRKLRFGLAPSLMSSARSVGLKRALCR